MVISEISSSTATPLTIKGKWLDMVSCSSEYSCVLAYLHRKWTFLVFKICVLSLIHVTRQYDLLPLQIQFLWPKLVIEKSIFPLKIRLNTCILILAEMPKMGGKMLNLSEMMWIVKKCANINEIFSLLGFHSYMTRSKIFGPDPTRGFWTRDPKTWIIDEKRGLMLPIQIFIDTA